MVLIKPGESVLKAGIGYTIVSMLFGWWGFPWGLIYTPMSIATNFKGGEDLTDHFYERILPTAQQPAHVRQLG